MASDVQGSSQPMRQQVAQDQLENAQQNAEDKKAADQIKGVRAVTARALRRRSSWPEKDRPQIGRAKAARAAVVSRFNRHEHRLVTVLWDGSEAGVRAGRSFVGPMRAHDIR